mgnify:CR=1 FL=1
MPRRVDAWMLVLGLAVVSVGCAPAEMPSETSTETDAVERPNVVLIMADDLGYGDIGAYGGWIETPALDRLAADGLRFTDFHSSGNVCSPTRAGLMTGRYQQRAGIPGVLFANPNRRSHHQGIGDGELTLAEAFRAAGYATAVFGKWHLGYQPEFNPVRHGFDEFRGFVSGNVDYQSHIDAQGRADWWQDDELASEDGYLTRLITEHAVRFIDAHRDEPFFLYLPHHAPHYPFQGPGDPADRSVGGTFPNRGSAEDPRRAYREMVQAMDAGVGAVRETLERAGLSDRTLVWFMSDNGATNVGSNGPLRGFKATDWEGGHRVPSLAAWPGRIAPGRETNALSSTLDVMPTVLSLIGIEAGAPLPGSSGVLPVPAFDGRDLGPTLFEGREMSDRRLFWGGDPAFWNGAAVRDGSWKLMIDEYDEAPGPPMLFDLATDVGEEHDLAPQHPERVGELMAALEAWKAEVGAR